jgi:TolA-binding protein
MTFARLRIAVPAAVLLASVSAPAIAQRPPTAEQQVVVLQQQLAASQALSIRLQQRLDAVEQQLQQIVGRSEETGHRVGLLEGTVQQLRTDQESRIARLESNAAAAATPAEPPVVEVAETPKPVVSKPSTSGTKVTPVADPVDTAAATDPGEDAYTEGFKLWEAKRYDQAITSLRSFTSAYPKHRRVSWANNLIGRSLLEKGQPFPAAQALLANYRSNPKGGRAQDSLYYLGEALLKYGQPAQACKAYSELTSVYGESVRAELKAMLPKARAEANCS